MRLTIENKSKQDIFVAIFQLLKNWSTCINICFDKDKLYIQSIDKSHVCLAYINIKSNWFSNYECINAVKVTVDAQYFAVLICKFSDDFVLNSFHLWRRRQTRNTKYYNLNDKILFQ